MTTIAETDHLRKWPWYIFITLALSASAIIYETRHFFFFSDDFLNFVIARDMGLTRHYLTRDVFGQFIPLYRLGFLVYWHIFGVEFWPFRVCSVLASWAIILIIWKIGGQWRPRPQAILVSSTILATSPVFVTNYQWVSAALSVTGSTLVELLALAVAAVPYPLNWKRRVGIAILFGAGLLLYPKALFLVVVISAVRAYAYVQGAQRTVPASIRAVAIDILPTSIVAIGYLTVVYFGGYTNGVAHPSPALLSAFISRGWNHGFLAAVLGLTTGSRLQFVIANVCVVVLLALSVLRNWKTSILWAGFAAYFVVSVGVIGWNRAVPFGLEFADTARYYADILCYCIALSILAFAPNPDAAPAAQSTKTWLFVSFVCSVGAVHFLIAAASVPHLWYAGPEKPAEFVANI